MTDSFARGTERAVLHATVTALKSAGWSVSSEPLLGGGRLRPDLVAVSPDGRQLVVEVKAGRFQNHIGAVAQVETYRVAWERESKAPVSALLILPGATPDSLVVAGKRAGVTIVSYDPSNLTSLQERLMSSLR